MSAINVNSITGRTGSHGPVLTGVTTVSSILHVGGGVTVTGVSTFNNNVTVTGGNVGIGTDNPTYQLQVFNDNIPASLRLQYGSNTGFDVQQMIDGSAQVWNVDNTDLKFATNDQERLRITSAGRVGVNTTTVSAGVNVAVAGTIRVEDTTDATQYLTINHQGIDFQNTGAGSSSTATSHLLDDYEEGTFTPTLFGATTAGTYTPATSVGTYTKIGRTVNIHVTLSNITVTSVGSGVLLCGGLPFASSNTSSINFTGSARFDRVEFATDTVYVVPITSQSQARIGFQCVKDNDGDIGIQATALQTAVADIFVSISYIVD